MGVRLGAVADDRDWLTLFNESWWWWSTYEGVRVPPRSWRVIPVPRATYYVVPGPLLILHCDPLEPMTARVQREIAHRQQLLTAADTSRLDQIYLRHDLTLLQDLVAPWRATP